MVALAERRLRGTSLISRVNGLVSDQIYFEADTGPDREPVKFLVKFFTARVLRRTGDYAVSGFILLRAHQIPYFSILFPYPKI